MINIGIISGGGELPLLVGKKLISKNYNVVFFVIKEFFEEKKYANFNTKTIKLNSLKDILKEFNNYKIDELIMLGKVNRPSIKDIKFDIDTIKFVKNHFLENKGDNDLLVSIQKYLFKKGFPFFDWTIHCNDLFANKNFLTKVRPSKKAILNINKANNSFKIFGQLDIGQSMIVQNEIILGLEASEGTDELIKRCYNYKKKGDRGVLIKLSKYKQSKLIDIPAIGLNTIKLLKKFEFEGVYLELDHCLILNKEETINYANINKIFIATTNKID